VPVTQFWSVEVASEIVVAFVGASRVSSASVIILSLEDDFLV